VFGSDLYTGFHGADRHYFIALPVYQLLQTLSFVLFGAGIAAARMVTVGSAVVVLWATTWLALRWYGLAAAIVSGLLLVLLRVNLVNLWPGLPLLAVGRSGRYDMTGVALLWLTVVLLDLAMQRETSGRSWLAVATGVCAGLATLTQFFGVFAVLIAVALLAWPGNMRRRTVAIVRWAAAGWAVVVVPYLLYVALHWSDFRGQSRLKAGRTDFLDIRFYIDNLSDEAARYQHLIDPDRLLGTGIANWLFVITIGPVLGWLAWRTRDPARVGDRILLTALLVCGAALALLDSTNAPLYTIVLWPGCCIAVAAAISAGLAWTRDVVRGRRVIQQRPAVLIAAACALLLVLPVVADGVDAYREDRQRRQSSSDYTDVASRLDAVLPVQTGVVGHERWWWGLHERQYLALNVLQLEWEEQATDSEEPPSFAALFDATGAGVLIVDDNARSEIGRYPEELRRQIESFLATEMVQAAVVTDLTYGQFEVYLRQ
jgi:4-amino-4-deoxy-L-arabinose transferase-like glycosyltransferase